jgi:hypothetical protein
MGRAILQGQVKCKKDRHFCSYVVAGNRDSKGNVAAKVLTQQQTARGLPELCPM